MLDEQHLADTVWMPQAVKEVMVGDFIADPALTNQFGIAITPVLKACQKFLKVDQLKAIEKAIDDQRVNMNACRKAHQTWAQLHGEKMTTEQLSQPTAFESQQTTSSKSVRADWSPAKLDRFINQAKQAVATAPKFQHQFLVTAE